MQNRQTIPAAVVGTFTTHADAEAAVKALGQAGFDIQSLSVIGKGFHVDEHVTGFYTQADRVRFWGKRGAFWGGLWSLFFGGVVLTVPVLGPVVALGYIGAMAISVLEGAILVGGLSAISAALYGMGIPKDSVLKYETAISNDRFLVMAHDTPERMLIARHILETSGAEQVDAHEGLCPQPITAVPEDA